MRDDQLGIEQSRAAVAAAPRRSLRSAASPNHCRYMRAYSPLSSSFHSAAFTARLQIVAALRQHDAQLLVRELIAGGLQVRGS